MEDLYQSPLGSGSGKKGGWPFTLYFFVPFKFVPHASIIKYFF